MKNVKLRNLDCIEKPVFSFLLLPYSRLKNCFDISKEKYYLN